MGVFSLQQQFLTWKRTLTDTDVILVVSFRVTPNDIEYIFDAMKHIRPDKAPSQQLQDRLNVFFRFSSHAKHFGCLYWLERSHFQTLTGDLATFRTLHCLLVWERRNMEVGGERNINRVGKWKGRSYYILFEITYSFPRSYTSNTSFQGNIS